MTSDVPFESYKKRHIRFLRIQRRELADVSLVVTSCPDCITTALSVQCWAVVCVGEVISKRQSVRQYRLALPVDAISSIQPVWCLCDLRKLPLVTGSCQQIDWLQLFSENEIT